MNYKNFIKLLFIGLFSVFWGNFVLAETCPTDNGSGVGCTTNPYYCSGSCRPASQVPQCPDYTLGANNCSPLDPGCDVGCSESTGWGSCGICTKCQTGYLLCSATSGPSKKCAQKGAQIDTNCSGCTWSGGTSFTCTSCSSGYTLSGGACSIATVRLGSASVSGTDIRQGNANSFVYINNVGASIGTSTIPEATSLNVVGASQFSSPLLVGAPTADGHAATKSYVDDSLASSTGAIGFWTQTIGELYTTDLTVNVGIGDDVPSNKLSVIGNITGSGSLRITGTATSSNYFASNLGIGGLPGGYWNRLVDLSGSGNSAYISRTSNTHAIMAASDTGTPVGTGYNFTYNSNQMVLGAITNHPINFITNGTSKMFLSNDGKLGIGTISPQGSLNVLSSSVISDNSNVNNYQLLISSPSDTNGAQAGIAFRISSTQNNTPGAAITHERVGNWSQGGLLFKTRPDNTSNAPLFTRMVIDKDGNIGIGTTTPEAKLDVNGNIAVRGTMALTGALYTGGGAKLLAVDNTGNVITTTTPAGTSLPSGSLSQTLRYGSSGWESTSTLIVNNSSNVGIGTTTPTDKLHVYGNSVLGKISGYPYKSLWTWESDNTGYYSGIGYQKNDGTSQKLFVWWRDSVIETNINDVLNVATPGHTFNGSPPNTGRVIGVKLSSNGDSYFNGGNVGIGTTNPGAAIHVNGNAIAYPPSDPTHLATKSYVDTVAQSLWVKSGNNLYTSTTAWNVGIGTTTPESKLDVNGSLAVRGAVSLTGPSYINQGSRLLMVDNSGAVSVTSTIPGGGGDYVSKTGDTMTGGLTFENIPAPGAAIDLNGFNIVGVNKITVTTIDPLYDIGGTKYSTYAPSVVGGVKEEYIGRGQISNCGVDDCSWRLDFSKVAIGSDLWVWRKIVEFNSKTIDVVMTAYGRPALLSYEIEGNQLIFYADRPTEFSYRLIGPRFDWRKWPTLAEDQSEKASLTIE